MLIQTYRKHRQFNIDVLLNRINIVGKTRAVYVSWKNMDHIVPRRLALTANVQEFSANLWHS